MLASRHGMHHSPRESRRHDLGLTNSSTLPENLEGIRDRAQAWFDSRIKEQDLRDWRIHSQEDWFTLMLELEALAFGDGNDERARFLLVWAVRCYNDIRRRLADDGITGDAQVRDALCTSPYAGLVERFDIFQRP
ncbi:hypothetical protein N7528_003997 [Penicillium herquei]|nr:hypothetical protein N7528_003997 [Penicillium herquei]